MKQFISELISRKKQVASSLGIFWVKLFTNVGFFFVDYVFLAFCSEC